MSKSISKYDLKELFTKTYGKETPKKGRWAEFYDVDVVFIDQTQETKGLNLYIEAQEKLIKRCDDIFLETHSISIDKNCGFV